MQTTITLSDELFDRAMAEAALRGVKLEDLLAQSLRNLLDRPERAILSEAMAVGSLHDAMQDCCGIAKDTPTDYASNPAYLEGFGQ